MVAKVFLRNSFKWRLKRVQKFIETPRDSAAIGPGASASITVLRQA